MTPCAYVIIAYLVYITISGRTSLFHNIGYGYFWTYIVPSHFRNNGYLCFVTDYYICVNFFISHVYFLFLYAGLDLLYIFNIQMRVQIGKGKNPEVKWNLFVFR